MVRAVQFVIDLKDRLIRYLYLYSKQLSHPKIGYCSLAYTKVLSLQNLASLPWIGLAIFAACSLPLVFTRLPDYSVLISTVMAVVFFNRRIPFWMPILIFLLAITWFVHNAETGLSARLPAELGKQTLALTVRISEFPRERVDNLSLKVTVLAINSANPEHWQQRFVGNKLLLQCFECPLSFELGEVWQLTARLKTPHGSASWNVFDFERFALANRVVATGYVIPQQTQKLKSTSARSISGYRLRFRDWLDAHTEDSSANALLSALAIGDRSRFDKTHWQTLRDTGLSHLMAISGLHVALVFLLAGRVARLLINRLPCSYNILPALYWQYLFGLKSAFLYALLAGLSIPTQRALIMLTIYSVLRVFYGRIDLLRVLLIAIGLLLVIDPLTTLADSFWLSVSAVFIIGLIVARGSGQNPVQWRLCLAMLPTGLILVGNLPFVGPIANMIVVPIVGLVILPIALVLAMLFFVGLSSLGVYLLWILEPMVGILWQAIAYGAGLIPQMPLVSVDLVDKILLCCLTLIIASWHYLPARKLWLLSVCIGLCCRQPIELEQGEFVVTVLDVGQALAVVIQTKAGFSLFDTGVAFYDSDSASRVILPYLATQSVNKLHRVIVSHHDIDHIGGLATLLDRVRVGQLLSNDTNGLPRADRCQFGQNWREGNVDFTILGPVEQTRLPSNWSKNNRSCVLKITSPYGSILLPGDIERLAEHQLLAEQPEKLSADVLVVPHHGSLTSTTPMFIDQVSPRLAIVSAGYQNRHNHPHPKVIQRLQKYADRTLNTAKSGSIQIRFTQAGLTVTEYRAKQKRFWYATP